MPFLLLGIGNYILALALGNEMLLWIGIVNILYSGGDLIIFGKVLAHRPQLVLDHPNQCGFIILEKAN